MEPDRFNHNFELSDDTKSDRVRRVEVITGVERRRSWPDAVKERIVAESMGEGVVISDVARRNGISPQQLFGWRRQMQVKAAASAEAPSFVPVVADEAMKAVPASKADDLQNMPGTIEIAFGAVVVRLDGRVDGRALATVLKALGIRP
jgi:transposase